MHPNETALAGYLDGSLTGIERESVEEHLASCGECLSVAVSAYESVKKFRKYMGRKNRRNILKMTNIYLILALVSFVASFALPRFFIQSLVATLLFGMKWIADSRSTKMLVMIHDAWRRGEDKEVSRILSGLEKRRSDFGYKFTNKE